MYGVRALPQLIQLSRAADNYGGSRRAQFPRSMPFSLHRLQRISRTRNYLFRTFPAVSMATMVSIYIYVYIVGNAIVYPSHKRLLPSWPRSPSASVDNAMTNHVSCNCRRICYIYIYLRPQCASSVGSNIIITLYSHSAPRT